MSIQIEKITYMPLAELWDENGRFGIRKRSLTIDELRPIIKEGPVIFVEANIGSPLQWIPIQECYRFWKLIIPNIAKTDAIYLDDYPGGFAYGPSEWLGRDSERIILLEKYH